MNLEVTFANAAQREFYYSTARNQCFSGGFNNGKTYAGSLKAFTLLSTFSNYRMAIARQTFADLKKTTMQTFFKICPREIIERHNEQDGFTEFKNKSVIYWMHLDGVDENAAFEKLPTIHTGRTGSQNSERIAIAGIEEECASFEVVPSGAAGEFNRSIGIGADDRIQANVAMVEVVLVGADFQIARARISRGGGIAHALEIAIDERIASSRNRHQDGGGNAGLSCACPLKETQIREKTAVARNREEIRSDSQWRGGWVGNTRTL